MNSLDRPKPPDSPPHAGHATNLKLLLVWKLSCRNIMWRLHVFQETQWEQTTAWRGTQGTWTGTRSDISRPPNKSVALTQQASLPEQELPFTPESLYFWRNSTANSQCKDNRKDIFYTWWLTLFVSLCHCSSSTSHFILWRFHEHNRFGGHFWQKMERKFPVYGRWTDLITSVSMINFYRHIIYVEIRTVKSHADNKSQF